MKHNSKNTSHWFWTPVFSQWKAYVSILLATFITNLFALAVPIYTMNVYDYVIPSFSEDTLLVLTLGITIALLFDFIIKTIRSYIVDNVGLRLESHFDLNLIDRILGRQGHGHTLPLGEQINLFRELQGVREYYTTRMATAMVDLPFILLFIFIIYLISPVLAVVPAVAVLIILIANYLAQIPQAALNKQHFTALQTKSVMLMELVRGANTISETNARPHFLKGWLSTLDESFKTIKASHFWSNLLVNFSVLMSQMTVVFILFIGVSEIASQSLSIGGLVAATILTGRIISPAINLSGLISKLRHTRQILQSLESVFEKTNDINNTANHHPLHDPEGALKLSNVSFKPDEKSSDILSTIDMDIKPNQKIALIGPSGAGKTTLLKLMARQISPSSGFISLDDHLYSQLPDDSLAQAVGYLPQNPFIFNATVKENILMGAEVTPERLKEVMVDSGLSVYTGTPHFHLDKQAGENGDHLSSGQIRAIALARLLIRDPKIILMDEPNNSMDQALEDRFQKTLKTKLTDKTVILITHKINLLPLMDYVYLMNDTKIVSQGTPTEILKSLGYQQAGGQNA